MPSAKYQMIAFDSASGRPSSRTSVGTRSAGLRSPRISPRFGAVDDAALAALVGQPEMREEQADLVAVARHRGVVEQHRVVLSAARPPGAAGVLDGPLADSHAQAYGYRRVGVVSCPGEAASLAATRDTGGPWGFASAHHGTVVARSAVSARRSLRRGRGERRPASGPRRLPVRRRPLRAQRAADAGRLLPLHPLPATDRRRSSVAGAHRRAHPSPDCRRGQPRAPGGTRTGASRNASARAAARSCSAATPTTRRR